MKTSLTAAASAVTQAWQSAGAVAAPGRPDVVVLFTDQWNPRCTGYAGNPDVRTPHLDQIAREGVVFDSVYSNCPVCMPARCSIISGLYPHNHGLWGNSTKFHMPPHMAPMFRDIRSAGYTTAQIGKLHWWGGRAWQREFKKMGQYFAALGLDHCDSIATPFSTPSSSKGPYRQHLIKLGLMDAYSRDIAKRLEEGQYVVRPSVVPPEHHNDSFVAQRAVSYIEKQPKGKPFCLFMSLPGPHTPLDAPGKYATMYDPQSMSLPANVPARMKLSGKKCSQDDVRRMRANYYGKISLLDDCFGQVVAALKRRGNWDNTLVVFSSDHGEMIGAHGRFSKGQFWEESVRVPLVMRWPGRIPAGQRTAALTSLFDIYPTIVEAVGGKLSPGHFAKSALPVATGKVASVRDAVFSEIGTKTPLNFMVRTERYKWWVDRKGEHLFDMAEDPLEQRDLIESPEHRQVVAGIKSRHHAYLRETQFNYAAGYKPMFQRQREAVADDKRSTSEALYERYKRAQQSKKGGAK